MDIQQNTEGHFQIERTLWLHPSYSLEIPLGDTLPTAFPQVTLLKLTNLQSESTGKMWRLHGYVALYEYFSEK